MNWTTEEDGDRTIERANAGPMHLFIVYRRGTPGSFHGEISFKSRDDRTGPVAFVDAPDAKTLRKEMVLKARDLCEQMLDKLYP